jgi:hypothetical protein
VNCTGTSAELEQNIWDEIAAVQIETRVYIMGIYVPQYKHAYTCMEEIILVVLFLNI